MKLKEKLEKVELFYNIDNELETKKQELRETGEELKNRKQELQEIGEELKNRKLELQGLRTEIIELKDFINSNFEEEFKECDYRVNIKNCYIISLNGKKYIAIKTSETNETDLYTKIGGTYYITKHTYRDALNLDKNNKYKYIIEYVHGFFQSAPNFFSRVDGDVPEYEEHILKVYPELSRFVDNYVPNTYLKKIYYEVNDLGNKKLIK